TPCLDCRGVLGDEATLQALGAQALELAVGLCADQLGELRAVGDVQRFTADVRVRRRGAPPVQVVAALAPAAPVELGHRRHEYPRAVRAIEPVLRAADRQLPAHLGLRLQRMATRAQSERVQRAALAAGEPRTVEEYACAVDDPGAAAVGV